MRNGQEPLPSQEDTPALRPELVPGNGQQPKLRGKRRISPLQNPQSARKDAVGGDDPLQDLHPHPPVEDDAGSMPPMLPGSTKAKRRRRRQHRKEKLRRLLHSEGVGPLSVDDPYRHTWDRERGRNSSSSDEEDRYLALVETWPRHSTPRQEDPPHRHRVSLQTPEHTSRLTRRQPRANRHLRRQSYHQDARHAEPPCSRQARSLDPSSARGPPETQ